MRRFNILPALKFPVARIGVKRHCSLFPFRKSYAFTRDIDESLKTAALTMNVANLKTIDLRKARLQHENLSNVLRDLGLEIHKLSSDGFPDSVFIEDTCVIIGKVALITNPGAESRKGEIDAVRKYLKDFTDGTMIVTDLFEGNVDGGDVLFTGHEILVGLSSRTNELGIRALHKNFPEYPIRMIDLAKLSEEANKDASHLAVKAADAEKVLHLKSFCSMCGHSTLLVGGKLGQVLAHQINVHTDSDFITRITAPDAHIPVINYEIVAVPDTAAANVVYVNGTLVRRSRAEFPLSDAVFRKKIPEHIRQVEVEAGELAKVDGALTCCSLLF